MPNPFARKEYYISANKLSTGISCPFKLYLSMCHVRPIDFDTTYTSTGHAVHRFAQDYFTGNANPKKEYYLNAEYETNEKDRKDNIVPIEMYERYDTCVNNLKQHFKDFKFECEVKFEKRFTTPKGRLVVLNGIIDAENEDFIYDWKTGKDPKDDKNTRQAHVYDFVRDFKKQVIFTSLLSNKQFVLKHENPLYIPKLCDEFIDRIEEHDFGRNRQYMCKYCEYHESHCQKDAEYDMLCFEIIPFDKPVEEDKTWDST